MTRANPESMTKCIFVKYCENANDTVEAVVKSVLVPLIKLQAMFIIKNSSHAFLKLDRESFQVLFPNRE